VGNSFSGASNKWVQGFFVHMNTAPDGSCHTWSHWDEGGKKFGVYKDGDVVGNTNAHPNSLEVKDKAGRLWKLEAEYVDRKNNEYDFVPKAITCDGKEVKFPDLFQPTALALAGNREPIRFVPGAGREAGCVTAAGDYVLTGGWKERGRIWVKRMSDGAKPGVFEPGPIVGGVENTGWIDILTGITAFERSNGEYLVFIEEDYKAKSILYRWKPWSFIFISGM
jgi:hypothetical protein